MNTRQINRNYRLLIRLAYTVGLISLVLAVALSLTGIVARAAPQMATAPGLGAAASYSALGKAGVTNTGNSVLSGKVGADLLTAITGFPPGISAGMDAAPDVNQAEADASAADLALTAQAGGAISAGPDLTGANLVPGVYSVGAASLPGVLTLNGSGVYIFLATALTSSGSISLTNGAAACNVFWHVTSGAAITGGSFVGTIIAGTSITFGNAASLDGRALALTGNVTLINNSISGPGCAAAPGATATTSVGGPTATAAATSAGAATATAAATSVGAATAVPTAQVILSVSGADNTGGSTQASSLMTFISLGVLGLGFILLGFVLRRRAKSD